MLREWHKLVVVDEDCPANSNEDCIYCRDDESPILHGVIVRLDLCAVDKGLQSKPAEHWSGLPSVFNRIC